MPIGTAREGGPPSVEWRFRRGWSEGELASRLRRLDVRNVNFAAADDMTAERGWDEARSCAPIAREPPGPPFPGGAFERARHLVAGFEHSDPRIVVAHFDPAAPLSRRPALLQIQALGLRFLCPVAVAREREAASAEGTSWGFAIETLRGHIARGREWFVVEKDARSGEVLFRMEAIWRAGDFPGPWAWLGYELLGRRYQRAWHRLAHARLRCLLAEGAPRSARGLLAHSGRPVAAEETDLRARRAATASAPRAREDERMRWNRWVLLAGFGALAGARSTSALALLAIAGARREAPAAGGLARALLTRSGAAALAACAMEMAADKWPRVPPRTSAPALAFRALSGATSGGLLAASARGRAGGGALLGGASAVAATFATSRLRQLIARRVREPAAGFVEDALVLGAGGAILGWMGALRRNGSLHAAGSA